MQGWSHPAVLQYQKETNIYRFDNVQAVPGNVIIQKYLATTAL
jgi:hypothetical protein